MSKSKISTAQYFFAGIVLLRRAPLPTPPECVSRRNLCTSQNKKQKCLYTLSTYGERENMIYYKIEFTSENRIEVSHQFADVVAEHMKIFYTIYS